MTPGRGGLGTSAVFFGLTALALSVGWGIRGNFGHEYGALMPGALAAMAVVLQSGRPDWHRRVAYFALFGALGWSFGGSQAYMWVIGYTHSGDSLSVIYGFACLSLIGFLWAAPGGAGTAFPAYADRERMTDLIVPMTAVFAAWWLQGKLTIPRVPLFDQFDVDWVAASFAIVAALLVAAGRRRFDRSTSLILHMAIGWWVGFLVLTLGLGLRMNPPRGDNWSGMLGLTAGLFIYLVRTGLAPVARAMLITGFLGGIGFASASMFKLIEIRSGIATNWHSILEQTTGLFNGLALAFAMAGPARDAPPVSDDPPTRRWTEIYAVMFVLVLVTYLNFRKNANFWVQEKAVPAMMGWLSTAQWFDLAYLLIALAVFVPLLVHFRRPLPLLGMGRLGRAQLLFLVFLWWIDAGNFERIVVAFEPVRLVTEGVIHLNAAICTLLALIPLVPTRNVTSRPFDAKPVRLGRTVFVGLALTAVVVVADWGIVRAVHGDHYTGQPYSGLHIRFGPNATAPRKDKS